MHKLKQSEIPKWREDSLDAQGHRCMLCCDVVSDDAVADHDHKTGHMRGVLHRGCNAMLGHIENNRARNGLQGSRLFTMLARVEHYLKLDSTHNPLHPTFRDEEAKAERRRMLARKRRAEKKGTT